MGRIVWGVAVLLVLSGLYLLLAGSVDVVEGIAMGVCALACTALAVALAVVAKRHYRPAPPPRALLHPLAALLPELVVVGRQLVLAVFAPRAASRGHLVEQPFEPGGDAPRDSARRALTVLGVSLAPRSFVVRGERTETLLLHALPQKPPSPDTAWPA